MNSEHYADPTCEKALAHCSKKHIENERVNKLLEDIIEMCSESGFHVDGFINLTSMDSHIVHRRRV